MYDDDKKLKQLYFERCRTALERRRDDQGEFWTKPRVSREAEDIYRKSVEGTGAGQLLGVLSDYWKPIHYPRKKRNKKTVHVHSTVDGKPDSKDKKLFGNRNKHMEVAEACAITGPSIEGGSTTTNIEAPDVASPTDFICRGKKGRVGEAAHRNKPVESNGHQSKILPPAPSQPHSSRRSKSQPRSIYKTISPKCPCNTVSRSNDNNYRLLPYNDRLEIIRKLRTAETDITQKLNKLPIRTDTNFLIRQKEELNRRLLEIDRNRELFSRPKVYVLKDAGSTEHVV